MSKRDLIISVPKNRTVKQLQRLQALPLEQKVNLSLRRIEQFIRIKGYQKTFVLFPGGKDSTVLLDLVRRIDPHCEAVFVDTGLEFEEIKTFVKTIPYLTIIKPKMLFNDVIEKYGYPVVSKTQAMSIRKVTTQNLSEEYKNKLLYGDAKGSTGKIAEKWKPLLKAPFKISEQCCDIMKKNPGNDFIKKSGKSPFIGTMTEESENRKHAWVKNGCNMFNKKQSKSTPLSFWTEKDIWDYINSRNLEYSEIYDKGADRTGCVFCMFGYWSKNDHKTEKDRMELLRRVDPIKYNYCMKDVEDGGLGLKKVIDYIDLKLNNGQPELEF